MQRILILVPSDSSFASPLINSFKKLGYEVLVHDYRFFFGNLKLNRFFLVFLEKLPTLLYYKYLSKKDFPKKHTIIMNELLLKVAEITQPNILFVVKGENILPETIRSIKRAKIKTILWMVDPVDVNKNHFFMKNGPYYDIILPCEDGAIKKVKRLKWKNKIVHMMAAADDAKILQSRKKKIYDVVFVGTYSKYRENLFLKMREFNLAIWGHRWQNSKLANFHKGILPYDNLLDVYSRSKIVICTNQTPYISVTNRVFEAGESGALVITEYNKYLHKVFKIDKEIVCYSSVADLKNKIEFYLRHGIERNKKILSMQARIRRSHTYDIRIREVFRSCGVRLP